MPKQRFRLILLLTAVATGLVVIPASADTFFADQNGGSNNVAGQQLPEVSDTTVKDVARKELNQTPLGQTAVLKHWTPEHMRSAKAYPTALPALGGTKAADGLLGNALPNLSDTPRLPASASPSTPTEPTPAVKQKAAGGLLGGALPNPNGLSQLPDSNAPAETHPSDTDQFASTSTATEQAPEQPAVSQKTIANKWTGGGVIAKSMGVVYITLGGKDYKGTGTVIESDNKDIVLTAGHLVNDGIELLGKGPREWASNFMFAPGSSGNNAPYGKWTARALRAPDAWTQQRDLNHDVGFAVLDKQGDKHIQDVTGAQQIAFNAVEGATVQSFGYPLYEPYNGESLRFCNAAKTQPDHRDLGRDTEAINCFMSEGSSGGAWCTKMQPSGVCTVVSLNSYSYEDHPEIMSGPKFGGKEESKYREARGL